MPVFYAAPGARLLAFDPGLGIDFDRPVAAVETEEAVQCVWPHPSKPILFVAMSNRFTSETEDRHWVRAYSVGTRGQIAPLGAPRAMRSRALDITVDSFGSYLLAAFNTPSGVAVYPIDAEGNVGPEIEQSQELHVPAFAHQLRMTPSNRAVMLVCRGNDASPGKAEDPGAIVVYGFEDGQLARRQSVAPNGGANFGPRNLDFDPEGRWVYVALERQNELHVYELRGDMLSEAPLFVRTTLRQPQEAGTTQYAGALHVHPSGGAVYVANRADGTVERIDTKVFAGGVNEIAVFSIDRATGEPTLVQNAATESFHVRSFSVDRAARVLVAASVAPMLVDPGAARTRLFLPAFSVFDVMANGTLGFVRKHDVHPDGRLLFWCGFVPF